MKIKFYIILIIFTFSCQKKKEESTTHSITEASGWEPDILRKYKEKGLKSGLPDFSNAGYQYGKKNLPPLRDMPKFDVTRFGAIPNDDIDDTDQIQLAINKAADNGGGIVFFPTGKYLVNADSNRLGIIKIDFSNIVLKGAGKGTDGSIIFSGNKTSQIKNPWLSPFVIQSGLNLHPMNNFFSVDDLPVAANLTKDTKAGEDILHLSNTESLNKNDQLIVAMRNTTDEGDLINELIRPAEVKPVMTSVSNAGKNRTASFQWLVEVDEILDAGSIRLKRPAIQDIRVDFNAFVSKIAMLTEIGIEDMRFESAWDKEYIHHIDNEADYGWGAINLYRVANGWVKNVHFDNYTQNIHLFDSKNITVEDVEITGNGGHYGIKCYSHSCDNLIQQIKIMDHRTHALSLEGNSYGNVFRNIKLNDVKSQKLDLHGMADAFLGPPSHNLFENIAGVAAIIGGGALFNLPHSGRANVFWDIEIEGYHQEENQEIFDSYLWRKKDHMNQNISRTDAHLMYPGSIVVRAYHPMRKLMIDGKVGNQDSEAIYVEGLNGRQKPVSLYEFQKSLREN